MRGARRRGYTRCRPSQRSQGHSALALIDQSPLGGAVITQPVMLDTPLLLSRSHERRHRRFSWLRQSVGLDQEQFTFSQFQERFATLHVGTSAKHFLTPGIFGEQLQQINSTLPATELDGVPLRVSSGSAAIDCLLLPVLPTNRQPPPTSRPVSLLVIC